MALHPKAEGLKTLQQHEGVERALGRAPIAQALNASPQSKGNVAIGRQAEHAADIAAKTKRIPMHKAVIRSAGLAHQGEFA